MERSRPAGTGELVWSFPMPRKPTLCFPARSRSVKNVADARLERTSPSTDVFQGPENVISSFRHMEAPNEKPPVPTRLPYSKSYLRNLIWFI